MDKKLARMPEKGLVLCKLTYDNQLDPTDGFIPHLFMVGEGGSTEDLDKFRFGTQSKQYLCALTEDRSAHLIVMDLEEAKYFFHSIRGNIQGDLWRPFFEAPVFLSFQAKRNQVVYIGNVHLILRHKTSDSEHRAGPVLPALDQGAIAGATFDVEIRDNFLADVAEFRKVFPQLNTYEIQKAILPAWRRPTAEEFDPKDTHFGFY